MAVKFEVDTRYRT